MKHRTVKICQTCGKSFSAPDEHFYCPECAIEKKMDTVIRIRECVDCGIKFYGGPRAQRCPDCAYKRRRQTDKEWRQRGGATRSLGSIDKCQRCGAEYIVKSGRAKYCDACKRVAELEWQREHKAEYNTRTKQHAKRAERRTQQEKECIYCLRKFKSNIATNVCSDYCRAEQKRLRQCKADIRRGIKRDIKKLEDKRERYRNRKLEE